MIRIDLRGMSAQFLGLGPLLLRSFSVLFGLQSLLFGRPRFHIRETPYLGCLDTILLEPPRTRSRCYNRGDGHERDQSDDQDDDE